MIVYVCESPDATVVVAAGLIVPLVVGKAIIKKVVATKVAEIV